MEIVTRCINLHPISRQDIVSLYPPEELLLYRC